MAQIIDRIAQLLRQILVRPIPGASEVNRLFERGADLIEAGRYEEAIPILSRALEMAPDDVEVLERRATAFMMLDDEDSALADLRRAHDIDPHRQEVQASLCSAYSSRDPQQAIDHCDRALQREPDDGPSLNNRSVALTWLGREEEAAVELERALALAPDEPFFLRNRAIARIEEGDLDGAETDIAKASAHWPTEPDLLLASSRIAFLCGREKEAQDLVQSVLKRTPEHSEALVMKGMMAWLAGNCDEAIRFFEAALAGVSRLGTHKLPRRVEWMARYGRGIARRHLGQETEGLNDLKAALALRPRADRIFERWGLCRASR